MSGRWWKLTTRHHGALTRVVAIEAESFDEAVAKAEKMMDRDTTGRVRKRPLSARELADFNIEETRGGTGTGTNARRQPVRTRTRPLRPDEAGAFNALRESLDEQKPLGHAWARRLRVFFQDHPVEDLRVEEDVE